jgi:CO/xanthine dehydrogenase Mo-binding subunit
MYDIPNLRLNNHRVPGITGYLKASNLRSPLDVSFAFASEQALDELAHMAGIDPLDFRRRNMSDPRWLAVLDAVAKAAQWRPRTAASPRTRGTIVTGRGVGLGTHMTSYGAAIADVRVNRSTGAVVATHMYGACRQSRGRRKSDQRPVGTGREPAAQGRSDVLQDQRHQPRLEFVSHPAVRGVPDYHGDRPAARGSEVHRRRRGDHGRRLCCHR